MSGSDKMISSISLAVTKNVVDALWKTPVSLLEEDIFDDHLKKLVSYKPVCDTLPIDLILESMLVFGVDGRLPKLSSNLQKYGIKEFQGLYDALSMTGNKVSIMGEELVHVDQKTIDDMVKGREVMMNFPPDDTDRIFLALDPMDGSSFAQSALGGGDTIGEAFSAGSYEVYSKDEMLACVYSPTMGINMLHEGRIFGMSVNLFTGWATQVTGNNISLYQLKDLGIGAPNIDVPAQESMDSLNIALYYGQKKRSKKYSDNLEKSGLSAFSLIPTYANGPNRMMYILGSPSPEGGYYGAFGSNMEKAYDIALPFAFAKASPDMMLAIFPEANDRTCMIRDDGSMDMSQIKVLSHPSQIRFTYAAAWKGSKAGNTLSELADIGIAKMI